MVSLADYYKHQISSEGLEVSQEYNAFDWPRFFFGRWNQLYRWINRGSVSVKMEGIEAIVDYLTGKATTFGRIYNIFQDTLGSFYNPFIDGIANFIKYFNVMDANTRGMELVKRCPNIYNLLYMHSDSINWSNVKYYRELLDTSKKMMVETFKHLTLPNFRKAYTQELNALKLFRPAEVENDIRKFSATFAGVKGTLDPKIEKEWEALIKDANEYARSIVNTVLENVQDGNGYIQ